MPALLSSPSPRSERALEPERAADHRTRLVRLAWSLCGSHQLAEDLTQETYVRVLSRPRRVKGGGEFPYLARTLRNVLNDHWSRERRRPPNAELVTEQRDGDPELAILAGEIYAAVGDLPDYQREVVSAVDLAGLSYAQAARALRVPPGTVMSRLHRARSRLADALGEAA